VSGRLHPVVEGHQGWQAIQRERSSVDAARIKWSERVARERAAHEAKVRAYNEEVERALLMAENPDRIKSPGDWRPPAGHAHVFTDRAIELEASARSWAARRRPELSAALAAREAAVMREAASLFERLSAVRAEVESLRETEDFLRAAAGLLPVIAPRATLSTLAEAAARGTSLVTGTGALAAESLPVDLDAVDIA
jgi:hypothetical protein